ncbi:MAG: Siroheme synthase [Sodalis sp.]|nr:MAG: Siroheme synthase [Sodalis sp.]
MVGAGQDDSGLLVQQVDVVLYDYPVSQEILELVRRNADRICVSKRAGEQSMLQQDKWCVQGAILLYSVTVAKSCKPRRRVYHLSSARYHRRSGRQRLYQHPANPS